MILVLSDDGEEENFKKKALLLITVLLSDSISKYAIILCTLCKKKKLPSSAENCRKQAESHLGRWLNITPLNVVVHIFWTNYQFATFSPNFSIGHWPDAR